MTGGMRLDRETSRKTPPERRDNKCVRCLRKLEGRQRKYCSKYCSNVTYYERNWTGIRFLVWARDNGKCTKCGRLLSIKAIYDSVIWEPFAPVSKEDWLPEWIAEWLRENSYNIKVRAIMTDGFLQGKKFGPYLQLAEIDHIVAICNGGDHLSLENLQTLCHDCHIHKTKIDLKIRKRVLEQRQDPYQDLHDTSLEEWIQS